MMPVSVKYFPLATLYGMCGGLFAKVFTKLQSGRVLSFLFWGMQEFLPVSRLSC